MQLYVNGERIQNLTGLNSNGWNRVGKKTVTVHLNEGSNAVRLFNTSGWMPDMDYMKVELLEADGIAELPQDPRTNQPSGNHTLFDLSGRRILQQTSHLQPGYYILNGRKVAIK